MNKKRKIVEQLEMIEKRLANAEAYVATGPRPRPFRWRAVPMAIVGAIGCASVGFGLFSISTSARSDWIDVFDDIWMIFLGSCFITSSILWWKGRWRLGIVLIAACVSFPLILFVWAVWTTG